MVVTTTWSEDEIVRRLTAMIEPPYNDAIAIRTYLLPSFTANEELFKLVVLDGDKEILLQMPEYASLISSYQRAAEITVETRKRRSYYDDDILDDAAKLRIALWYLKKFDDDAEAQRFLTAAKEAKAKVKKGRRRRAKDTE